MSSILILLGFILAGYLAGAFLGVVVVLALGCARAAGRPRPPMPTDAECRAAARRAHPAGGAR